MVLICLFTWATTKRCQLGNDSVANRILPELGQNLCQLNSKATMLLDCDKLFAKDITFYFEFTEIKVLVVFETCLSLYNSSILKLCCQL